MKSKKIKWLIWAVALTVLFLVVTMVTTTVLVPRYLEEILIPEMARKYGLDARQVDIQRIGLFGTQLGPVHIDGNRAPVVRIAALHIDYTPLSLLQGHIKSITFGNLSTTVEVSSKGLSIPGLKLPTQEKSDIDPGTFPDLKDLIPMGVGQIRLSQWEVVVLLNEGPLSILIDMTLTCGDIRKGRISGDAKLSLLGSTLALTANLDQGANHATFKMESDDLSLNAFSELIDLPEGVTVAANAKLKGQSRFQLTPFKLSGLTLSGQLLETDVAWPQGTLGNLPGPDGTLQPISITLETPKPPLIEWHISPFLINASVKSQVFDLKGDIAPHPSGWELNAAMDTVMPIQDIDAGMSLTERLSMTWQAQARQNKAGSIEFNAHTTDHKPLALKTEPFMIKCPTFQFQAKGHYANQTLKGESVLSAKTIQLGMTDGEATVVDTKIDGTFLLNPEVSPLPSEINAKVKLTEIRAKRGSVQFVAPGIEITASGHRGAKKPWHYRSHITLTNADVTDPSQKVALQGIHINLPIQWPFTSKAEGGKLKVNRILWDNRHMGDLKGRLRQKGTALTASLRHNSKLFPKMNVLIDGNIGNAGGTINVKLPAYQFTEEVDLGRFFSQASDVWINGQIEASAKLTMDDSNLKGTATFQARQGSLRDEQRQLTLEGIRADIILDDLMGLKSTPQQKLRVGHLEYGNLMADDLEVDFQLKGQQTLRVERTQIKWCQGLLSTAAIQISPDKKDYDVTLFCEKLNLAMVLEQLGTAKADGDGTVSGKIPLRWNDGKLRFDRGFLHSTPGQPSAIQLTGTEVLLSGLPPGTPQHAQVDIAIEALKDYTYKWAKLNVESEGEDLLLKLQFDGKPNQLLPFAFDKELGRFKRVAGQGQAEFKGIGIDLNFNSPLDKILHYKKLLTPNQ